MFTHTAVITYTNRLDLLERAAERIRRWWSNTYLIDNSIGRDLVNHSLKDKVKGIIIPPVRLTCSQASNAAQELARNQESDVLFVLHEDAGPKEGACARLEAVIQGLFHSRTKWGAVMTRYDALCAFNMDAVDVVGEWDTTIEQYPADVDYYHRLAQGGYQIIDCGGDDVEHFGSSTVKKDIFQEWRNKSVVAINRKYHNAKWAGEPTFPFDGKPWDDFYVRALSDPVLDEMMNAFQPIEGSLFHNGNRRGRISQFTFLYNILRAVRPKSILETGTNKCLFAYFVAQFIESFNIVTCDTNRGSAKAVSTFAAAYPRVNVDFRCGDSRDILGKIPEGTQFDLVWIDGDHDYEIALSDLKHAIRLNVRNILVDDTVLPPVKAAIRDVLGVFRRYYMVDNPYMMADSDRCVTLLRSNRQPDVSTAIDIKRFLTTDILRFGEIRTHVCAELRRSARFSSKEAVSLIERLQNATDPDMFDEVLDELYNYADDRGIWLGA